MSEDNRGSHYDIGYGKPPMMSRFRKGQSGNRKGRPKGSKNNQPILMKILETEIDMYEDGIRKKVSIKEAMYLAQVKKALKGDVRSFQQLMKMVPEEKNEKSEGLTVKFVTPEILDIGKDL